MMLTIVLPSVVSALVSVLALLLGQHLLAAATASAQPAQPVEMRASAFLVVGPDGSVIGRLGAGGGGNGNLGLYDAAGTQRVSIAGGGTLSIFDADGVPRFRAGYQPDAVGPGGQPPFNGILLDPDGAIEVMDR